VGGPQGGEGSRRRETRFDLLTFRAPSDLEITTAAERARADYLAQRRLSLPRSMLGRTLEIFLALDRACFLAQNGLRASVVEVFPAALSLRNLAVLAWSG